MADTPDLGKIVSLIMENPTLIAEISALAKGDGDGGEKTAENDNVAEAAPIPIPEKEEGTKRLHRTKLIGAMKPYLSKERQRAVDTMLTIVDILDRGRGAV